MGMEFEHTTLGQRVLFGSGKAAGYLAAEVTRLDAKKVMVIASQFESEMARQACGEIEVALWHDDVVMHVPVETAEKARAAAVDADIDLLVSVGGGSTTGLAKAVALTTGIPIIAVPTTYAGSEATNVWGLTEDRTKTTGVDDRVLPVTVVYDAQFTVSLPAGMSVASGLNALAHCVDSLWAPKADPINQALALEGVRALAAGLTGITADSGNIHAREQSLYGCYLAAVAFASAGSGLHHKICHVLGGTFNLPHAETHAVILPYVLALNAPAVPELAARLAAALGHAEGTNTSAVQALNSLRESLNAPKSLADYGFTPEDIPEAVRRVLAVVPESNPTSATEENITALLSAAQAGDVPAPELATL
jgi:maleylacetate reductase